MLFFSSDHHFGHKNIIQYCNRPYASVEEMNEDLIKRWNETVLADDDVIYLGDFSLNPKYVSEILPRLNGHKLLLVSGNHDRCWKAKPGSKWHQFYLDHGFQYIEQIAWLEFLYAAYPNAPKLLRLSHLPYTLHDERDFKSRPIDDGQILLCGHVHDAWKVQNFQVNVGVDVWNYRPVSLSQILKVIKNKKMFSSRICVV